MKKSIALIALSVLAVGCTRIETGEVGLRVNFNGSVEPTELGIGYHQTVIGDVLKFVSRETNVDLNDLNPQTLEKTPMKDFDAGFTYAVTPTAINEMWTQRSKAFHRVDDHHDWYLMYNFVERIGRNALYKAVAKVPALEVNDKRSQIEIDALEFMRQSLKEEHLDSSIAVTKFYVRNTQLPDSIAASAANVVTQENNRMAKEKEVQIAILEKTRIEAMNKALTPEYLEFMRIQALQIAANKGSLIVVPANFTALGQLK